MPGDGPVTAERVDHPRVRRDRRHPAEELSPEHDQQHEDGPALARRVEEDLRRRRHRARRRLESRHGIVVSGRALDGVPDAEQQDVAEDHRHHDRLPDALRPGHFRGVCLLGHVRRRVVARERVLREQHPDQEDVERRPEEAGREAGPVDEPRGEDRSVGRGRFEAVDRAEARVLVRHEEQDREDDQHAGDVPPDAHVVQERDQPDPEGVHQAVQDEDRPYRSPAGSASSCRR